MDNRNNDYSNPEYTIVKLPDGRIVNMNLKEFKNSMDNGENQQPQSFQTEYNQELK